MKEVCLFTLSFFLLGCFAFAWIKMYVKKKNGKG